MGYEVPYGILELWQSDSKKLVARRNRSKAKRPKKQAIYLDRKHDINPSILSNVQTFREYLPTSFSWGADMQGINKRTIVWRQNILQL